jgi:long-chain fatty acid transport protein
MRRNSALCMNPRPLAVAFRGALAATILMLAGFGCAQAGGIFLYEVGTPDMFTAGAGWAARAQDAATAFTNPAGMARLKGGDLLLGAGALYGDYQLTPNANTQVGGGGGDGGVAVGWFPNGGAYYAHELSERWWFGLAATSDFGLAESYDPGWVGRYYVEKSTLIGVSFVPSVAYRVNPKLSFGASLNAMYGVLKDDVAINSVLPAEADGKLSMNANDLSFGGNFGALCELSDKARLGATYTSPVKLDFVDRPEFTDLGPGMEAALDAAGLLNTDLGIGVTVPQTVTASFYCDLSADWALMGDFGWQDWSQFGGVNVEVATDPPSGLTADLPYKDTWRGALGAKRRLGGTWLLSAGVGYDSPMVEDTDRSVVLPTAAAWRFAAGAQRQLSEKFQLGFGYTFLSNGSMPVDQERGPLAGRVAGTYENAAAHVLSLQGHWKL